MFRHYHESSNWPPVMKSTESVKKSRRSARLIVDEKLDATLSAALNERESAKAIESNSFIDQNQLSQFLYWSASKRMYPSAGSLYLNKIYIDVQRVEGIAPGLYTYESEELKDEHRNINASEAFVQPDLSYNFCIIIAADFVRAEEHYGDRGYRFCLLEAGHIMQNIMLVAASLNYAIAPIGGFHDEKINKQIPAHTALYLAPVGLASNNHVE